ncbi:TonB-dependent receptor [uncultured Sphingomonas sp.]|uniref:TonB-dependent receptor n=1 Tax=uncultured Sphingomonas sp. TaxID=158754 RepID=UPI002609E51C|nr:TonB-dependent receptor [uncultured Sphingomonas sp.]
MPISSSTSRYALQSSLTLVLGALALSTPVHAQETKGTPPAAVQTDVTEQEDVVVTGQALPGAVIGNIPPENQLTPADIAAYGVNSVSDLLDQISDQTSSIQGRGSSGPVVLVNGKRISGINEVGDLPTEAIARLDILPEEVALKYGYSATQKVVNIILRRRFHARVVSVGAGAATESGGGNASGEFGLTKIRDNERLNVVARARTSAALRESQRGIIADPAASDPANPFASDTDLRTLQPSTRNYSLNSTYAYQLSPKLTASLNGTAGYQTSRGLVGGAPLSAALDPNEIAALRQDSNTFTAHGGVTLNYDLSTNWKLSFTGTYDHSDTRSDTDRFQSGNIRDQHGIAIGNTAGASLLVSGPLFALPGGKVRTSFQMGGNASQLTSTTDRLGAATLSNAITRSTGNAQLSFDIPLTSTKTGFLSAIGTLTANINGELNQLSDYGTLGTFGYGLNWTPRTGISVIASVNEDRVAPTLQQLEAPLLVVPNVRIFDYVTGQTVQISQIIGGNPNLRADDRHVFKLGFSVKPVSKLDLTINANYLSSRVNNPIGSLTGASLFAQNAFPDRFIRDENGELESIDARPLNFAREEKEQLRWGVVFSKVLRAATRPTPPPGGWPRRNREGDQSGRPGADGATRPPQQLEATGVQGAPGDVVVNGGRGAGADSPPPPPGDMGPPPEGFGGPRGGPDGHGEGFGGPGGGFGAPGGGRRGGFGGGRGGGGNEARLQLSIWHTWAIRDTLVLRDGAQPLDLLAGDTIGAITQPRHQISFNAGVVDNGVGLRLSGSWSGAATTRTSATPAVGDLHFSSLAKFNLRLFANIQQRLPHEAWARGLRLSLGVNNIFDSRQRVTDATGATPLAYQPGYLDPMGRTISLSLRKMF